MIAAPVAVSPVNVIPFTSGCVVMNSPAESGPKPCHHVVDARGDAGLVHDLGEAAWRWKAFLRGLRPDPCSAGERRRELPGEQQQRQVPGRDHADHAERLRIA